MVLEDKRCSSKSVNAMESNFAIYYCLEKILYVGLLLAKNIRTTPVNYIF
jgi:hypothetical protein